jgi:DNA-binding response OmpR family regulator
LRVLLAGVPDRERVAIGEALELSGYAVEVAATGHATLRQVRTWRPHLVVLDFLIRDPEGFRVLRELRADGYEMPILVLSTRGTESDKVLGFRLGADAYVTVPCGMLELLARVEALLRRSQTIESGQRTSALHVGDLEIDPASRTVRRDGRPVELRPRVFDLLVALARRRGVAISRQELLHEVWVHESDVGARTVDMHVAQLRRQLGDDADDPRLIVTVRKLGYRLVSEP